MIHDPVAMNGLGIDDFFSDPNTQPFLIQNGGGGYGSFQYLPSAPVPTRNLAPSPSPSSAAVSNADSSSSPEESEVFSDIVLNYISKMLMEEDVDEKVNLLYQEQQSAILAAEKPFYDALGEHYPPLPLPPPPMTLPSPPLSYSYVGGSTSNSNSNSFNGWTRSSSSSSWASDFSQNQFAYPTMDGGQNPSLVWQFNKGVEEARKFLPSEGKLVIDLQSNGFSPMFAKVKEERRLLEVKAEEEEEEEEEEGYYYSRGRKNPNSDDGDVELDVIEGRSSKQSAVTVTSEETLRSDIFDQILLCHGPEKHANDVDALREAMQKQTSLVKSSNGYGGGKGKGKKKKQQLQLQKNSNNREDVVDLRTLLIHCAQAVAADDRRTANELLKKIRQSSSPFGDGSQRLAQCFADGLEARLAGTGSQMYRSLMAKRATATDILKAYQLYLAACPFKRISHFFSNTTIMNVAENASTVHIIDFGIYFGFQWPCLIQRLAKRPGGPPKLRITGIDVPQPGFRPTERIEETGKRLAAYAEHFGVSFQYSSIASKWEKIRVEDLKIHKGEVLIVNCLYRFRNLVDETVVVDSPRNMVLNTIRKANPDVFIHGIVNGSYSAPFFVTRFREALFHFSALFDMLETTVPREDAQRLLLERDLFGREALNVISCEGPERVERPETYKQWQVRNFRAGFTQLPLNSEIMKKARDRVKGSYHKDFVFDEDSGWLLQGWKGRIIYAISTWM